MIIEFGNSNRNNDTEYLFSLRQIQAKINELNVYLNEHGSINVGKNIGENVKSKKDLNRNIHHMNERLGRYMGVHDTIPDIYKCK